ncbi:MAG: amidohydrolase family protein [Prolixibacteraceae bacterium]|nr:amidohydrolase family protein [Prolixibacteraceae bacterium]MBT6007258.1 amidohydrolase family protein [Prolixibacteraceae bacterium]MBT6766744.1 amidohydrolase family protein [Prolixibacteraceae bacterium]MBT6998872.1 amidohydrolase family protein [Prolixibacteraceae bacterium]MBT7397343.1 amidohydrolase family protein [Prolixibacteraceae bacterium]
MRKIAATYIFSGNRPPIKNGILICENDGTIVEIIENQGELKEQANLEYYSGILVPGFVNAHCHLELSHLKGKVEEKTGIGNFIGKINKSRNADHEQIESEIYKADRRMWAAGIAAVGDISNTGSTIKAKQKSKIFYHTFVETFGFLSERAERAFEISRLVQNNFRELGLKASIVPHSPYSVSGSLFNKIKENASAERSVLTIHNQESNGERQFFKNGTGPIANHLKNNLGIDISHWKPTGKSSLVSILEFLPAENQLLLVHNTFTKKGDIETLKKQRSLQNTFFVLCPNSNLYIENQLPPVTLFQRENLNICLGTDSLASNQNLSVLGEIITLQQNFPEIELEELINWACFNGARALRIEDKFGSFEPGKTPGINLITGVDLQNLKLLRKSKVKRLA